LGGTVANQFYEGDRRSDIVVRLAEHLRTDVDALADLPIMLADNKYVPLKEVADLQLVMGYSQVYRENGKRRVVVSANVRGRDLGSFVQNVQQAIEDNVDVPAGYWVEYGGTYQKLQSATQRLSIVVPITLALVIGLLIMAYNGTGFLQGCSDYFFRCAVGINRRHCRVVIA